MVATRITIRINWNALTKDRKQKNFQKFSNFQKIVQIQFFSSIAFVLSKNIFQLVIFCRKQALKRKQDTQLSQNAPLICAENVPINSVSLLLESPNSWTPVFLGSICLNCQFFEIELGSAPNWTDLDSFFMLKILKTHVTWEDCLHCWGKKT